MILNKAMTTKASLLIGLGLFLSACAAEPEYGPPLSYLTILPLILPTSIRSIARSISTMAAGAVGIMAGIIVIGAMPGSATVSPGISAAPDMAASAELVVEATARKHHLGRLR